ncbi:MAG: F0F1 ATP synthase subunit delta, partial [Gemmatimonas sp.]|uniref:F0F1 ATP synthase subunit delta n=1 Tax=Gemmatimonas sp. TaxID=1962908 RepID=UPI0039195CE9
MPAGVQGESVARNYAEALLTLARTAEDPAGWGIMLRQVATAMTTDITLSRFHESPRIAADAKSALLSKALGDRVPRHFLRFLQQLVR